MSLVLTRDEQSLLRFDIPGRAEPIVVRVNRIRGERVTLAIDAPRDVVVRRGELVDPQDPLPTSWRKTAAQLPPEVPDVETIVS